MSHFLNWDGFRLLPRGLLIGSITVLLIVLYSVLRYPSINDHSAGTLFFGAMVIGLSLFYAAWGLWWLRSRNIDKQIALRVGITFGLICGGLWIAELVSGNLMDTSLPAIQLLYYGSMIGVVIASGLAGYRVFNQTGKLSNSVSAGLWNGMISGLITFWALMFITFAFQNVLQANPENIQEVMRIGVTDFASASVSDALAGAINHLWIGPMIGMICGAIGGAFGKHPAQQSLS